MERSTYRTIYVFVHMAESPEVISQGLEKERFVFSWKRDKRDEHA